MNTIMDTNENYITESDELNTPHGNILVSERNTV